MARITGWSETYILWELPLARALAYRHAYWFAEGVWTVPSVSAETENAQIARDSALLDIYIAQTEINGSEDGVY